MLNTLWLLFLALILVLGLVGLMLWFLFLRAMSLRACGGVSASWECSAAVAHGGDAWADVL